MTSWWNFGAAATPLEPAYDWTYSGTMPTGEVLTALRDYACGCLEQRLIPPSGTAKMFVSVFPINRQTWVTNIPYKVEAGYGVPVPLHLRRQRRGDGELPHGLPVHQELISASRGPRRAQRDGRRDAQRRSGWWK